MLCEIEYLYFLMDSLYRLYHIQDFLCVNSLHVSLYMPLSNKYRNINELIELEINR